MTTCIVVLYELPQRMNIGLIQYRYSRKRLIRFILLRFFYDFQSHDNWCGISAGFPEKYLPIVIFFEIEIDRNSDTEIINFNFLNLLKYKL